MPAHEDVNLIMKLLPYGAGWIFTLHFGIHRGFVGGVQDFISIAVVIKFIHYIAMRTSRMSDFILSQIAIAVFYYFIFYSFFRTTAIFLLIYDVIFAFYIYGHFQDFSDATLDGAYARFKKALASYGFK